jgi:hypothetical protein
LDDQAWYFAENANLEIALRFLACARATFELLAGNPRSVARARIAGQVGVRVFRVCDFEKTPRFSTGSTESGFWS